MNLGRPISFLIVILVAFGYLLSDDGNARKDLKQALIQRDNLNAQVTSTTEKLTTCENTVQIDQQTISQLRTDITSLNHEISVKQDEIGSLKAITSQQAGRITELEGIQANAQAPAPLQTFQPASAGLHLDPIMLTVVLTVQLVLFLVQNRQKKGYVRLSAEERAQIIKMRRGKKL